MFDSEYLAVFLDESQEHLQAINDNLLKLEQFPKDLSILDEVFRSAHTLKGMASAMGFEDLAYLTHIIENVFDSIRNRKLSVTSVVLDIVFSAIDYLEFMIQDIAPGGKGKRDVSGVVKELESIEKGDREVAASLKIINKPVGKFGTYIDEEFERNVIDQLFKQGFALYQINVSLDEHTLLRAARVLMVFNVLNQVGEIIKSTPSIEDLEVEKFELDFQVTVLTQVDSAEIKKRILKVSEITDVTIYPAKIEMLETSKKSSVEDSQIEKIETVTPQKKTFPISKAKESGVGTKTIRVDIERLDLLMNSFEELIIEQSRLKQMIGELKNNELSETVERMSFISEDLQKTILKMRMMPVSHVFNRFPRMVRSLSKDLNKKVKLKIIGADTELDRSVIDELGDPLVHLLRNAIDHGIETPDKRKEAGKQEEGTVFLRTYLSGSNLMIEIEDDGGGIDRNKVLKKALEKGIVLAGEVNKMSDQQVFSLLFSSGFSTVEKITDVSGRGVGLDVVLNTFESLGGIITVNSVLGKGSTFSIQLPLTTN